MWGLVCDAAMMGTKGHAAGDDCAPTPGEALEALTFHGADKRSPFSLLDLSTGIKPMSSHDVYPWRSDLASGVARLSI